MAMLMRTSGGVSRRPRRRPRSASTSPYLAATSSLMSVDLVVAVKTEYFLPELHGTGGRPLWRGIVPPRPPWSVPGGRDGEGTTMSNRTRSEPRAVDRCLCPPGRSDPFGWSTIALHGSVAAFAQALLDGHAPPLSLEQVAALSFLHAADRYPDPPPVLQRPPGARVRRLRLPQHAAHGDHQPGERRRSGARGDGDLRAPDAQRLRPLQPAAEGPDARSPRAGQRGHLCAHPTRRHGEDTQPPRWQGRGIVSGAEGSRTPDL